jgi:hypothetical protein
VYPPERIVKSRLKHNIKPDKPNSISFDLKAIVKTENGTEVWRYAENVIITEKGVKKYTPKKFIFNGSKPLKRTDIELIYFLLRKSEFCRGGNNQGLAVKFMFEDLVSEAEKRAEEREIKAKVDSLIYNRDTCLPEEKLRLIATGYFINDVPSLTLAQVKNDLFTKVMSTPDGSEEFFRRSDADAELKARYDLQTTIDKEFLKLDGQKRIWFWQGAGDKGNSQACKVPPNRNPKEALYDLYMGDQSFREDIKAVLLTKNPNVGSKKKETVEADE